MGKATRSCVLRRSEHKGTIHGVRTSLRWWVVLLLLGLPQMSWAEEADPEVDDALIEPCDPFIDESCLSRVELDNGEQYEVYYEYRITVQVYSIYRYILV